MTKPNRLSAVLNRPAHERPTRPAPAYMACRAATIREQLTAELEARLDVRATLPVDPTTQENLARFRDALVMPRAPRVPAFPAALDADIELEVDALFAEPM